MINTLISMDIPYLAENFPEDEFIYRAPRDLIDVNTGLEKFDPMQGNYNDDSSIHRLPQFIQEPIDILHDFSYVIIVSLIHRIVHLTIDLIDPRQKHLKDILTVIAGLHQILSFINKYGGENRAKQYFILIVIIFYATYAALIPQTLSKNQRASKRNYNLGILDLIVAVSPILYNEYLIHIHRYYHYAQLRAMLMTASMKLISARSSRNRNLLSVMAYLFHPVSCIFGPWHSDFNETEPIIMLPRLYISDFMIQLWRFSLTLFKALIILVLSSIIEQIKFYRIHSSLDKIQSMYFTAQEFRFGHYFACLISQCMLTIWLPATQKETNLCDILRVEWPRSLIEVVVSWNVPMHRWLKGYVFNPLKSRNLNIFVVILSTYLISSTLHGFKFNIWSVLLSLGLFSWVEYRTRSVIARILNACVLARDCNLSEKGDCLKGHCRTKTKSKLLVTMVNSLFRMLSIVSLAYLGCIFQGDPDRQSHLDVLEIWSEFNYVPHIFFILNLIPIVLIK